MNRNAKNVLTNLLLYGVFIFYILLLFILLFRTHHPTRSVNLVPFRGVISFLSGQDLVSGKDNAAVLHAFAISNLLGNIVIFVPLGVYVILFNNKCRKIWVNTLIILSVSLVVEILQVIFKYGIGDIDDVILNTLGGWIGILIYKLLFIVYKEAIKVRRFVAIMAPLVGVLCFSILILYNR